jgi:hypothetical protein
MLKLIAYSLQDFGSVEDLSHPEGNLNRLYFTFEDSRFFLELYHPISGERIALYKVTNSELDIKYFVRTCKLRDAEVMVDTVRELRDYPYISRDIDDLQLLDTDKYNLLFRRFEQIVMTADKVFIGDISEELNITDGQAYHIADQLRFKMTRSGMHGVGYYRGSDLSKVIVHNEKTFK